MLTRHQRDRYRNRDELEPFAGFEARTFMPWDNCSNHCSTVQPNNFSPTTKSNSFWGCLAWSQVQSALKDLEGKHCPGDQHTLEKALHSSGLHKFNAMCLQMIKTHLTGPCTLCVVNMYLKWHTTPIPISFTLFALCNTKGKLWLFSSPVSAVYQLSIASLALI